MQNVKALERTIRDHELPVRLCPIENIRDLVFNVVAPKGSSPWIESLPLHMHAEVPSSFPNENVYIRLLGRPPHSHITSGTGHNPDGIFSELCLSIMDKGRFVGYFANYPQAHYSAQNSLVSVLLQVFYFIFDDEDKEVGNSEEWGQKRSSYLAELLKTRCALCEFQLGAKSLRDTQQRQHQIPNSRSSREMLVRDLLRQDPEWSPLLDKTLYMAFPEHLPSLFEAGQEDKAGCIGYAWSIALEKSGFKPEWKTYLSDRDTLLSHEVFLSGVYRLGFFNPATDALVPLEAQLFFFPLLSADEQENKARWLLLGEACTQVFAQVLSAQFFCELLSSLVLLCTKDSWYPSEAFFSRVLLLGTWCKWYARHDLQFASECRATAAKFKHRAQREQMPNFAHSWVYLFGFAGLEASVTWNNELASAMVEDLLVRSLGYNAKHNGEFAHRLRDVARLDWSVLFRANAVGIRLALILCRVARVIFSQDLSTLQRLLDPLCFGRHAVSLCAAGMLAELQADLKPVLQHRVDYALFKRLAGFSGDVRVCFALTHLAGLQQAVAELVLSYHDDWASMIARAAATTTVCSTRSSQPPAGPAPAGTAEMPRVVHGTARTGAAAGETAADGARAGAAAEETAGADTAHAADAAAAAAAEAEAEADAGAGGADEAEEAETEEGEALRAAAVAVGAGIIIALAVARAPPPPRAGTREAHAWPHQTAGASDLVR
eukprot:g81014.t1